MPPKPLNVTKCMTAIYFQDVQNKHIYNENQIDFFSFFMGYVSPRLHHQDFVVEQSLIII